jgi:DNA-binding MarR family transcriptional regulator
MPLVDHSSDPTDLATAKVVLDTVPPLMRAIREHMREGRPAGISIPQFRALVYIRRRPGTDLSAVAEHLGTSLPAASELIARLVRTGLVERTADPSSRRRMRLSLTPAGAGQLDGAEARTVAWIAERLADVDGSRLRAIRTALEELAGLLSEG